MFRKGPGYCPQCGERVTPFAAGCAICGADLDPRRWDDPPASTAGRLRDWVMPRPRRRSPENRRAARR